MIIRGLLLYKNSSIPGKGIKVSVWHKVLHSEHRVLEALDDLRQSVLEFLLIRSKQDVSRLQHKLRQVQRDLRWLLLLFFSLLLLRLLNST